MSLSAREINHDTCWQELDDCLPAFIASSCLFGLSSTYKPQTHIAHVAKHNTRYYGLDTETTTRQYFCQGVRTCLVVKSLRNLSHIHCIFYGRQPVQVWKPQSPLDALEIRLYWDAERPKYFQDNSLWYDGHYLELGQVWDTIYENLNERRVLSSSSKLCCS